MNKKAAIQLSVNFLVILIICIVIFGSSIFVLRKFFSHAGTIKGTYDERVEKQIEALLDDGSRVAIPFDRKKIPNGEFETFGIGVLNMLGTHAQNSFEVTIKFSKAFNKDDSLMCEKPHTCPPNFINPGLWLKASTGFSDNQGITLNPVILNNKQKKFLIGAEVSDAREGTYIFDVMVCYDDGDPTTDHPLCTGGLEDNYDNLHKIYIEVP